MLDHLHSIGVTGGIATVSTCSGTNERAQLIESQTNCICEAMEGAAVVHTANRLGAKAIEIRAISNTTGNRDLQKWDIECALTTLGNAVQESIAILWNA